MAKPAPRTAALPKSGVRRRDEGAAVADATGASFSGRRRHNRSLRRRRRCSGRLLAATTLLLWPTVSTALDEIAEVTAPGESLTAGGTHSVEWVYTTTDEVSGTTGDLNPFSIELRSCAGDDDEQASCGAGESCGNPYRTLCGDESCMDSDGSYDVVIPEDVEAGNYVFSVTYLGSSGWTSGSSSSSSSSSSGLATGCSGSFSVEESAATSTEAVLEATAPSTSLQPGDSFTAEWEYDDGAGEAGGSFEINLYSCAGDACANDSCGTFEAALCGDDGCYDPGPGDYDVRVPTTATPGTFKLQVKKTSTTDEACTADTFDVVEANVTDVPTPSPVDPAAETVVATPAPVAPDAATATPKPVPAPTAAPMAATAATAAPAAAATVAPEAAATAAPEAAATPEPSAAAPASSDLAADGETPGTSPTPVPTRVTCAPASTLTYSHSTESTGYPLITIAHESGDRDEGGCTNFSGLWAWVQTQSADVQELVVPADPETGAVDSSGTATGGWLLRTSVDVTNGVMFEVMGTGVDGGDSDKVFIGSSDTLLIRLRGAGGHLHFQQTHVTSWVETLGTAHFLPEDAVWGAEPRSYIVCLSEILEEGQTCEGVAQKERGECRMDVIDSTIAYLGYEETESYGLSWKVRGLCDDLSNQETLFESIRVYGDITDSVIVGLWYGHYSYGHLGGVWTNNILHDNHVYGFDPHDDSDYLTISGNTCYNNGDHGIIASKRCDHLLVENNESYNNGGSGLMLHKSCDDSIVRDNTLYGNVDAGMSLVETSRTLVSENTMNDNKYGIRILVGSSDNEIFANEFDNNTQHDIYLYIGSDNDEAEVEPYTGINMRNSISDNVVSSTTKFTAHVEDSEETVLTDNTFFGKGAFSFVRSDETRVTGNTGDPADATPTVEDSCFTADSGISPECT